MKLTKIKLINWHLFTNSTIEVEGNFLITGENGCGKSTLTDALYYVLSGGDDKNFNNAANANAKRTLVTYLRGKIGNEGKECLRNSSSIIGHIALEYIDDKNASMVFGCVIELTDNAKPNSKFYVIQNYSIDNDDYVEGNYIRNYRDFKNNLLSKKIDISDIGLNGTQKERRNTISKDIFKLEGKDKYIELLRRAIAFKPIDEVSSFVDAFLLKEDHIAIDSLMEEIRSYRETKNNLDKEYKKLKCLESFVPNAEKFDGNTKKLKMFDTLLSYIKVLELKNDMERLSNELLKVNERLKQNNQKFERENEELKTYQYEQTSLENNDAYTALKQKKIRLDKLEQDKIIKLKNKNRIDNIIAKEKEIMRRFGLKNSFVDDIREGNFPLFKQHVKSLMDSIKILKEDKYEKQSKNSNKLLEAEKELSETKQELEDIKKGKNKYNQNTTKLINLLREKLEAKYNKKIEIKPLCEYLEIIDERWTNAIEGYLNTQRFDIIIEPIYYDAAVELYERYKKELDINSVGIVRCENGSHFNAEGNTLFDKLEIHNKYAKYAAYIILSKVVCVDNVMDLKNYKVAITDTCMVYQNRTVRNINPKIYAYPFIGRNSIIKRKQILESKIANIEITKKELLEVKSNLNIDIDILNSSEARELAQIDNVWAAVENIKEMIDKLKKEIEIDETNEGLLEISNKIDRVKENIKNIQVSIKETRTLIDNANIKIGEINTQLSNKKLCIENAQVNYEKNLQDVDNLQYENFKTQYYVGTNYDKQKIEAENISVINSNNAMKQSIEFGMRQYVTEYSPGLSPLIENTIDFIRIYYELKDRDIVDYRDQANAAYERAQESFKADFVSKLYERIGNAHNEIRKINRKLKDTPFGADEEIYEFTYSPSDDDEMKEYYKLIMSGRVMEAQTLLDETFTEREQDVMRKLFDSIITEGKAAESEQKLYKYLDYRQYMKYDIKTTNKYGEISMFSKINKEKSGGETQTPFYVIIAACFDRLMKKDNNSTCTVIFDEAFNNMDEGRINSLMEFYKKLNIQLAIVVPSNRMATLASYMDSVVGLIKLKNQIRIEKLYG